MTERIRWLYVERGEAVFRVRHDAAWPFVVVAGATVTRDIGTAFDVLHVAGRTDISLLQEHVQIDASFASSAYQQLDRVLPVKVRNAG